MTDLFFILLSLALFALAAGYIWLCRDEIPEVSP